MQADPNLKTAFLQAKNLSDEVWVVCPKVLRESTEPEIQALVAELFGPEFIAKVDQSLYGTRDAGVNLDVHVRKLMASANYVECPACPNLYLRYSAKGVPWREFAKWRDDDTTDRYRAWVAEGSQMELDGWIFVYVDDLLAGRGLTLPTELFEELQTEYGLKFKEAGAPPTRFTGISFTDSNP